MHRWILSLVLLIAASTRVQAGSAEADQALARCRAALRAQKQQNDTLKSQVEDMAAQLKQAATHVAPAPASAPKALAPGSLSEGGYAQSRWGMSLSEVGKGYPKARVEKASGDLIVRRPVAERPARIRFQFKKGRLAKVQVVFDAIPFATVLQLMEEYKRLEELLGLKYGSARDEGAGTVGAEAAEPAALSRSVSQGRVHLSTTWESPLTRIVLSCDGEAHKMHLRVDYESMELLFEEQQRLLKDL